MGDPGIRICRSVVHSQVSGVGSAPLLFTAPCPPRCERLAVEWESCQIGRRA